MSDKQQQIRLIFEKAIGISDLVQRQQFIDQACGSDEEVRRGIAELFSAINDATGLLDSARKALPNDLLINEAWTGQVARGAGGVEAARVAGGTEETRMLDPAIRPGIIIAGKYKLLENIGEGGMGSVWVAEQISPVKRRVAIKMIKAGMDSKQVLARFEAERQALALMDHPNIAKVFDGGITDQGRPYFVMEYVKGIPFTEYCDQARVPLKERLQLFVPVCSAVQHAHQKGIIHRDLKPSNILICLYDGKPVPKVIDFGLAKAMHQSLTDHSIYTAHGMMVGTPLYMSPEQAEQNNLDIDTRTDIYSLGVMLYEVLVGSTPLEKATIKEAAWNEVLRLIKEVEPPRPSTRLSSSLSLPSIAAQRSIDPKQLQRSLSGDLDWIVMKALEKERTRRFPTATSLADDLTRYLSGEAVEARPPSTGYRIQKFLRRYRRLVVATAATAAILLMATTISTWAFWRARTAEQKATLSEKKTSLALADVTRERDEKEQARAAERDQRTAAEQAKAEETRQRKAAEKLASDLERKTYRMGLQSAYAALENGEIDVARSILDELPESLRGWEWKWLHAEAHPYLSEVTIPDGKELVTRTNNGRYAVLKPTDSLIGPFEIIDAFDGKLVFTVTPPECVEVKGVCIASDALQVAMILYRRNLDDDEGFETNLVVWDPKSGDFVFIQVFPDISANAGDGMGLRTFLGESLSITNDGNYVSYSSGLRYSKALRLDTNHSIVFDIKKKTYRGINLPAELSPFGRFVICPGSPNYLINVDDLFKGQAKLIEIPSEMDVNGSTGFWVSAEKLCLRTASKPYKWRLIDLALNQTALHYQDSSDPVAFYAGGEILVAKDGNRLEVRGREGVWRGGPVLPTDYGEKFFHVDEANNRLFFYTNQRIVSLPLPKTEWLEVLSNMDSGKVLDQVDDLAVYSPWNRDESLLLGERGEV